MTDSPDIIVRGLSKSFGRKRVLEDVSFTVERGRTFALLGRNGAGKTTTLRLLLGLLKPDSSGGSGCGSAEPGSVTPVPMSKHEPFPAGMRVLGLDPCKDAIEVRRRVGYLAEDQRMFSWMTVEQITRFMAPFYPTWDTNLANRYLQQFELSRSTKIKHLSKGQTVRLGLLLALAHRPQVIILDDPALGLDPIMRKQFNRDLIMHLQSEGRTVFYSSHLLYEVEPIADQVAILDRGRIVIQQDTETLRHNVKQLRMASGDYHKLTLPLNKLDVLPGPTETAVTLSDAPQAIEQLRQNGVTFRVVDLNLDEIFEAYVIGRPDGQRHADDPKLQEAAA
ncbi:MAG: ABC transporter ATP-binding protein [Phycisphaeraceae bacterium]|nr:ABC transporter ATP-binding protein [Phycisphaeraceae bacterium]